MRDIALFDDDLWIGTHNGLRILDLLSGSEKELRENALDPFSLSDNSLSVIYRDYEGHAWIGTMFEELTSFLTIRSGLMCSAGNMDCRVCE